MSTITKWMFLFMLTWNDANDIYCINNQGRLWKLQTLAIKSKCTFTLLLFQAHSVGFAKVKLPCTVFSIIFESHAYCQKILWNRLDQEIIVLKCSRTGWGFRSRNIIYKYSSFSALLYIEAHLHSCWFHPRKPIVLPCTCFLNCCLCSSW